MVAGYASGARVIYAGSPVAAPRYDSPMGRTALYRDPAPFRPARAEVQLDCDVLVLTMPDGGQRRHVLDGCSATLLDGFVAARGARTRPDARPERRFVRMLILERDHEHHVVITPPDRGAVAPSVVRLPEAPDEAAIVDDPAWDALTEWIRIDIDGPSYRQHIAERRAADRAPAL